MNGLFESNLRPYDSLPLNVLEQVTPKNKDTVLITTIQRLNYEAYN